MRKVIAGDGSDSTTLVRNWLAANNELRLANIYLIGDVDDPLSYFLTDWESPLSWPVFGTFQPATINRKSITTGIGLEVDTLQVEWSPKTAPFTSSLATANPFQRVILRLFDNMPFRVWTAYMPTPGDANTFGCSELFGGRISKAIAERDKISFTITSFLDVVNQNVPPNVIELTNTLAAYSGATPPPGQSSVPLFSVIVGSTQTKLYLRETGPDADHIFSDNELRGGFVVFDRGGSQTLGASWSAIYANKRVTISGTDYNEVVLYTALPWAPTPGVDTCYATAPFPMNQSDSGASFRGFPYCPSPSTAV